MAKIKVSEIRAKFPMYEDLSDDQLISGIRQKFYSDIPIGKFAGMIDYDTQRQALGKELTDSMSATDTVRAGWGKAIADTATGVRQLLPGGPSRASVDDTARRDAPLMNTTGGKVGHFGGSVATAIPALAAGPGLVPAAATGAALGFAQPVGTEDSRTLNAGIGGAAGAGGVALGRLANGAWQAGKAMVQPFTEAGREKIAGRVLQRFAEDPSRIGAAQGRTTITGARPTLAEETGDAGIARLQDSLRSLDPQINNQIGARLGENNAARVKSLQGLAGDSAKREALEKAREDAAGLLYRKAFLAGPMKLNAAGEKEVAALLEMPAIKDAMKVAQTIAKNKGVDLSNPTGSAQGLHFMKLALDDAHSAAGGGGGTAAQKNAADGIKAAQKRLVGFLEDLRPDYKSARQTYAAMSKPLNAMDVGEEVARRGTSNLNDLAGNPRMQANALAGALRDEPALIQRATGRKGINALADVMEPDQLAMLRAVAAESDRAAAVGAAGNGPGSATAQRMASQNIINQMAGPLGLPQSWAESVFANTVVGKPLNLIYGGVAEPKIQQALAEAVLDPAKARAMLAAVQQKQVSLPGPVVQRLMGVAQMGAQGAARASAPVAFLPQPGQR